MNWKALWCSISPQSQLTPRELHTKAMFFPKLMDGPSAEQLVLRISSIGDRFGFVGNQGNDDRRKHKYDVWIANQVKRELLMDPPPNPSLLDRENELFMVLDWAIENKPDLMSFNFEQAFDQQKRWLDRLKKQGVVRPQHIDLDRVLYKCSNGYFLYLLKQSDLNFEGSVMGHCVGLGHYKTKLDNKRAIIISLRDEKNMPHVTIEVSLMKGRDGKTRGTVLQQQGKGNVEPSDKYHAALREFILFSNGALTSDDADFLTKKEV